VSSSANEALRLTPAHCAALTPRLAGALAASLALHAYAIAVLDALPRGMRWGEATVLETGAARRLRVALRAVETPPPPAAPGGERARQQSRATDGETAAGARPEPALSPLPATRYYTSKELDVQPGILVHVEPEYPEAAARRFLSGRVVARLMIDASGAVESVAIVSADPPGYFEAAAEKAFLAARFTPGMKDGRAVRVQLLLEISFDSAPPPKSFTGA
jgi:TonB family protein